MTVQLGAAPDDRPQAGVAALRRRLQRGQVVAQNQIIYIEHKSGHGDSGPAWITRAQLSKSGRTVYFNGRALKSLGGQGISGNYYCLETGDEFWVSGVKVR